MNSNRKVGVLLVNLGTPQSPSLRHVFNYLNEFLTDPRVIDLPWFKRQLLVRGIIVPAKLRQSTTFYQKLWMPEGSPLLVHGLALRNQLQIQLGECYKVVLGMRYQQPSLAQALEELKQAHVDKIVVLPLFPQYASATTGSVHQKIMELIKGWNVIPELHLINSFPDHPAFINALLERSKEYPLDQFEHVLFSFHGLPERHLTAATVPGKCQVEGCCQKLSSGNQHCYKGQCYVTVRALSAKLGIGPEKYTVCFQSRLGKDPWITPYTSEVIHQLALKGIKRVLVFCPAFVCDCLETTIEISHEYAQEFRRRGGELLQLVEGLNSHPIWIEGVKQLILENEG